MTRRSIRNLDWTMLFCIAALLGIGLLVIYSASQVPALPGRSGIFNRQILWMGLGFLLMLIFIIIPFRIWEEYSHFIYAASIVLLLLVPVLGVERLGARRWLVVGGFQFQPSEVAKLATLLMVSRMLARPRIDLTRLGQILPVLAAAGLVFVLILMEPDLGTSLSIPAYMVPMLYWAGLPLAVILVLCSPVLGAVLSVNLWVWLVFLGVVGVILAAFHARRNVLIAVLGVNIFVGTVTPFLWNSLKPYQQERILTFVSPERDRAGAGYQVIQSKIAMGSGGVTGHGYLKGTQKGLAFLPQQHTDFVFSVLGEEFGFVGCAAVLFLFALLVSRILRLAVKARSRFAGTLVVGIAASLVFHVVVNVSMTLGLAPVTGLPLPFLSYGGTFLMATMAQMGLLLNVSLRRNEV
jgi:rod shape determining protein RodA